MRDVTLKSRAFRRRKLVLCSNTRFPFAHFMPGMKRSQVFWKPIWLLIVEGTLREAFCTRLPSRTLRRDGPNVSHCSTEVQKWLRQLFCRHEPSFRSRSWVLIPTTAKSLSTKSSSLIVSENTSPSPEAVQNARMTSATSNRRMERSFAHLSAMVALWENRPLGNWVSCIEPFVYT